MHAFLASRSSKLYLDLLPNEIVARILDFGDRAILFQLSHTCCRFREAVHQHPIFSGVASLHSLGPLPLSQGNFNLFLKQLSCSSNPVNVDLILTAFLPTLMMKELIEALANNLHRITSLLLQISVDSEANTTALLRALSQPAPEMRWFRFVVSARISRVLPQMTGMVRVPSTLFGGMAPQLRTVLITTAPAEIISAFSSVQHLLMIRDPEPQELADLRFGFPALRHFDFSFDAIQGHGLDVVGPFATPYMKAFEEMTLRINPILPALSTILGHLEDDGPLRVSAISKTEHMQPGHPGLFRFTLESQTTGRIRRFIELHMNGLEGVAETFTRMKINERVTSLSVSAPDLQIAASLFPKLPKLKTFEVLLTREILVETFYPPVLKEDEFYPDEDDPDFDWLDPSIGRIECPNLEKVIVSGTGNLTCSAVWLAFLAGHILGATARARFELELRGVQHVGDINDVLGGHFDSVTMRRAMPRHWRIQPRIIKPVPRPPIVTADDA